ncbi:AEC family transporter, partial [Xanthomonas citri]|uniref:AEC family transporter n=1 Tax=Xanthomonas citri TaxID=346 RepID=UPI000590AF39
PAWIGSGLKNLADAMLPLVMLSVGFSLQLRLPADELKPLAVGLVFKLLLMPVLALPLSWVLGLRGQMLQTNVLESAMPTMIPAAALAISHRLAPRLAAAMVGYSILLSLLTLPAWAWLLARLVA